VGQLIPNAQDSTVSNVRWLRFDPHTKENKGEKRITISIHSLKQPITYLTPETAQSITYLTPDTSQSIAYLTPHNRFRQRELPLTSSISSPPKTLDTFASQS
jgi:hypothetical protein